jgi:integrase
MSAPSWPAAWERYFEYLKLQRGLRPASISLHRTILQGWVGFLDPLSWNRATIRHLGRYLDRRPVSPRAKGRPRLAANTRLSEASSICTFYRWAFATRLIGKDRMAGFALPKGGPAAPRALELEEVGRVLDAAAADDRLHVALWLCFGAGLRVGEVARCQIQDLRFQASPPLLLVPEGKGGKAREVPLAAPVVSVLRAYLGRCGRRVGPLVESRRHPGEPMTPGSVGRMVADHLRACGVDESAHSLRHTYATTVLKATGGRNLFSVSKALGHSSTQTTERCYVLGYSGDFAELAALLPDPRTGNDGGARRSSSHPWLPVDLADQLGAALEVLERHGEQVATAMATVGRVTHAAWLRSLGLERDEQLRDLDPDALPDVSDEAWEAFELEAGIRRGWTACDRLRDAHPDG